MMINLYFHYLKLNAFNPIMALISLFVFTLRYDKRFKTNKCLIREIKKEMGEELKC